VPWFQAKYDIHVNGRYMSLTAYKISLRILVKTGKAHAFTLLGSKGTFADKLRRVERVNHPRASLKSIFA
jgi:hypothetical protein